MNAFARWCKFNLVGAIGMIVRLGSLAVINRLWSGHYMAATAVALELTLLHNFVWHVKYTWPDRQDLCVAETIIALSLLEWIGFSLRHPGADAGAGTRRRHTRGGIERDCNSVCLDCEL